MCKEVGHASREPRSPPLFSFACPPLRLQGSALNSVPDEDVPRGEGLRGGVARKQVVCAGVCVMMMGVVCQYVEDLLRI